MIRPRLSLVPDDYAPARVLAPGLLEAPLPRVLAMPEAPAEDLRNALMLLAPVEYWATSQALLPRDAEFLDALDNAQRRIEDAIEKLEAPPTITEDPRSGPRVIAWIGGALVLWCASLLFAATLHAAQVAPTVTITRGEAVTQIENTARAAVTVTVELRTDTATDDRIGGPVAALIAPRTFTLAPGSAQTVRVRLKAPQAPGTVLRLLWTITPAPEPVPASLAVARITLVSRIAAKVTVAP
jgi:hypothetical protein